MTSQKKITPQAIRVLTARLMIDIHVFALLLHLDFTFIMAIATKKTKQKNNDNLALND